jgi:hypothetical protein
MHEWYGNRLLTVSWQISSSNESWLMQHYELKVIKLLRKTDKQVIA